MTKDRVKLIFAGLDLTLALIYALLLLLVVPSRSSTVTAIVLGACLVLAAGGVAMATDASWSRRLAIGSAGVMVACCLLLIGLLVASAAYLHGIYGGIGQAGSALALLLALLTIEVVGLVPALQLVYLLRRDPAAEARA